MKEEIKTWLWWRQTEHICGHLWHRYSVTVNQENSHFNFNLIARRGSRCRGRMVVGFTTTYAISAYHHWCCEFESRSGRGVQHYVIKLVSDFLWFSPGPLVSSTNKTDRHDITEILLKVALNTIKQTNKQTNKLITRNPWFSTFLVRSNPLSRYSW
jgi:hypothetical protein